MRFLLFGAILLISGCTESADIRYGIRSGHAFFLGSDYFFDKFPEGKSNIGTGVYKCSRVMELPE